VVPQRCSTVLLNKGPSAPLVPTARWFRYSAPGGSPAPVPPGSVSNCWFPSRQRRQAIGDRLDLLTALGIGNLPGDQLPRRLPAIAATTATCWWNGSKTAATARPRSRRADSAPPARILDSKKSRDPALPSPPPLLPAISLSASSQQRLKRCASPRPLEIPFQL